MAISILVGNGVNQLNNSSASWEHVLRSLLEGQPTPTELEHVKDKPFALVYEEILLSTVQPGKQLDEMVVKRKIATLVDGLEANDYHRRIMASDVRHVLTTNYDYNLEKVTDKKFVRANLQRETKYSVFRRRKVSDKFVWHVHGESTAPSTITLGFDQYCGYLQRLRGHAAAERHGEKASPFKAKSFDFDKRQRCKYSWLDVFFRDDIHIIGMGFDFTEIDLWWALTYKARLRARGWQVGHTYYHDWHVGQPDDASRAKCSMLRALGAEVKSVISRGGYEGMYNTFLLESLGV